MPIIPKDQIQFDETGASASPPGGQIFKPDQIRFDDEPAQGKGLSVAGSGRPGIGLKPAHETLSEPDLKDAYGELGETDYNVSGAAKEAGYQALEMGPAALKLPNVIGRTVERFAGLSEEEVTAPTPIGDALERTGQRGLKVLREKSDADLNIRDYRESVARGTESFPTKVLGNIGPTAAGIATSFVPVVGPPLSLALFMGMNAEDAYQTALEKGATPENAEKVAVTAGTIMSLLDQTGISVITKKIPGAANFVKKMVDLSEAAMVEGGTEVVQDVVAKIGGEWAARNPKENAAQFADRMSKQLPALFEGSLETFKIAAATGGLFRGAGHGIDVLSEQRRIPPTRGSKEPEKTVPPVAGIPTAPPAEPPTFTPTHILPDGTVTQKVEEGVVVDRQGNLYSEEDATPTPAQRRPPDTSYRARDLSEIPGDTPIGRGLPVEPVVAAASPVETPTDVDLLVPTDQPIPPPGRGLSLATPETMAPQVEADLTTGQAIAQPEAVRPTPVEEPNVVPDAPTGPVSPEIERPRPKQTIPSIREEVEALDEEAEDIPQPKEMDEKSPLGLKGTDKNTSLAGFVRAAGGINEKQMAGDVRQRFSIREGFNLVNRKTGLPLDRLRQMAAQHGFVPEDSTPADFLEALRRDADALKALGKGSVFSSYYSPDLPGFDSPEAKAFERRTDIKKRKRINLMSEEEKNAEIENLRAEIERKEKAERTNPVSGIPNRIAYNEALTERPRIQTMIDLDGLKWINEKLLHEGGDAFIKALGRAIEAAGLEGYHLSGDEFAVLTDREVDAYAGMEKLRDAFKNAIVTVRYADGSARQFKGLDFSYGVGQDRTAADGELYKDKTRRETSGERAVYPQPPPSLVEVTPPKSGADRDRDPGPEDRGGPETETEDFRLTSPEVPPEEQPKAPTTQQGEMFSGSETMQAGTRPIIAEEAGEFFKPLEPEVEQPSLLEQKPEKEPWQMTAAEYRLGQNNPRVEAIQAAIKTGKKIALATTYRVTPLIKSEHIRVDSRGFVQIPEGGKWVSLTDDQVEQLSRQVGIPATPLSEKKFHGSLVEDALKAGQPVPPEVLKDYPRLRPEEAREQVDTPSSEAKDEKIRKLIGLNKSEIDAFDPEKSVEKRGNKWGHSLVGGRSHPGMYDTKREAVESARSHKALKIEQYENPSNFFDLTSLIASERLKLIEKYMAEGMTEMEAGAKARAEMSEPQKEPPTSIEQKLEEAREQVDPNPSKAQIEADNYSQGHIRINGLRITIENAKGSTRKTEGKEFFMHHDYGKILGTTGADKEHIDVYLGPNLESEKVFVVNQVDPEKNKFDEQKIMLGFSSQEEAKTAYLKQYDNPAFFGSMVEVSMEDFKARIDGGGKLIEPAEVIKLRKRLYDEGVKKNQAGNRERLKAAMKGDAPSAEATPDEKEPSKKKPETLNKLRALAERMKESANETLGRDTKRNTQKRAREAAHTDEEARKEIALAETMENLANAIESGEVKHLSGLSSKTQLEELNSIANQAKYAAIRSRNNGSLPEREVEKPMTEEDVWFAKYPTVWLSDYMKEDFAKDMDKYRGGKPLSARLRAARGGIIDFDLGEAVLEMYKKHGETRLGWQIKNSLAAIKRMRSMGITNTDELQSALREFVRYRGKKAKEDPIKVLERELVGNKIPGYFNTAESVVDRMVDEADIKKGMKTLEPSAGKGSIADKVKEAAGSVETVEINLTLRKLLEAKGHTVVATDFMDFEGKDYDRIVMNPPFENGQDIDHVRRAYDKLKPGGRVVAIMSEGTFFRGDKKATEFREWLDDKGTSEKLPEGSFKTADRPTGVNARMVIIDKPVGQKPDANYYYVNGEFGMKSDGSFTKEKRHWMTFGQIDAGRMAGGNIKPYGATREGVFVGTISGNQIQKTDTEETAKEKEEATVQSKKIEDFGEKIGGARKDTATTQKRTAATIEEPEETPSWRKRFVPMQSLKTGKWTVQDTRTGKDIREGWRVLEFESEDVANKAIPLVAVSQKHQVTTASIVKDEPVKYEIWRSVTDRKRIKVVDQQFDSREDAMRYMVEHAEEILAIKTNFGEEILAKPETVFRKGPKRRDSNVRDRDFLDTFGFRGVEFGNWNNQEERQEVMNHAYDGLLDLAEILNVPPRALSLNGELALAFGSRGQGLSGARAHYERDYGVINLTKMSGAGSLAHEWFHSLDHYFGRQDGKAKSGKVKNERGDLVYPESGRSNDLVSYGFGYKSNVRQEVQKAYKALIETMFKKAEKYIEDTKRAEDFVGATRNDLRSILNEIRGYLSKKLTYGKRNTEPATTEQLAAFDVLADKLVNGEDLKTEFRYNEGSKVRKRFGLNGRQSNDTLDAISAIYKSVRGRSGFSSENKGELDRVRVAMNLYSARINMLTDANTGTEKTKKVPTGFAMEAKRIDQGRSTDYWATPHEMAARAFSAYVEDKIAGSDRRSDFLSFGSDNNMMEYRLLNVRPFPEGSERKAINEAFDLFVSELKTKETEKGVALFSKGWDSVDGGTVNAKDIAENWQAIVKDIQRIIVPGSTIELVPNLNMKAEENRKSLSAWGHRDFSGTVEIAGLHRTVRLEGGEVISAIQIALNRATDLTPYHEAWHSVENLLLSDKEIETLRAAFPDKDGVASTERTADAFADWVAKKKIEAPGRVRLLFIKIRTFFEKLKNALRGRGFTSVEDLFEKAYSGELRGRRMQDRSSGDQFSLPKRYKSKKEAKKASEDKRNLKIKLRAAEKASKEGFRAGGSEERAKANAKIAEMKRSRTAIVNRLKNTFAEKLEEIGRAQELKDLKADILSRNVESIKQEIADHAKKHLPMEARGAMLSNVAKAKTHADLVRAFARIDKIADQVERKGLIAEFKDVLQRISESNTIAVAYRNRIRDLLSNLEFSEGRYRRAKALMVDGEMDPATEAMMEAMSVLARRPLSDLSNDEIRAMLEEIVLLEELGRQAEITRKELWEARKEAIKEAVIPGTVPIEKPEGKALAAAQHIDLAITPSDVIFDLLDGGEGTYKGVNMTHFKKPIDSAWGKFLDAIDPIKKQAWEKAGKLQLTNEDFERIGIYAAAQQEGGREKLLNNGLTEEEIDAIHLRPSEMEFYQWMRKELDLLWPRIAKIMADVYGKPFGKVKNYFSFMTDWEKLTEMEVVSRLIEAPEYAPRTKNPNMQFTKSRIGAGKQKIKLNAMEIFLRHTENAEYLINMGPTVKMLYEVANSPEYGAAAGDRGQSLMVQWLDLIARKGGIQGDRKIAILDILRRNVGVATMAFKLSSALVQPSSIVTGASMIGRYAFTGSMDVATSKRWREFLTKNFPEIRDREADDPAFMELSDRKWLARMTKIGLGPLKKLDLYAASSITAGAYQKYLNEHGQTLDFEKPNKDAIAYAELMLRRTQASMFFKDVPLAISRGALTGNRSLDKVLFQFQNFALNNWSLIRHDLWRAGIREKNPAKAVRIFTWLTLATLAEVGLRDLAGLLTGIDDDDPVEKEMAQEALNKVPFLSHLVSAIVYQDVPIPVVSTLMRIPKGIGRMLFGKEPETKARGLVTAVEGAGRVAGIPGAAQVGQTAREALSD